MKTTDTQAFLNYMLPFLDGQEAGLREGIEKAAAQFKPFHVRKNDYLVKEGQICSVFCYVESGILQHAIAVEEEEKTTYLALRNSVTSSLNSFLYEVPSRKAIKALVDTQLWVVDVKTFRELLKDNPAFRQFYYHLIERQIILIDEYRIDLLTLTPEERYTKLLLTEPKLLQEVPLHYLASFLGISTRHMSRIRQNIK